MTNIFMNMFLKTQNTDKHKDGINLLNMLESISLSKKIFAFKQIPKSTKKQQIGTES